jgi:hypothetical protein
VLNPQKDIVKRTASGITDIATSSKRWFIMASSSIPSQARSVLSYHDDLWHISWGETDSVDAVKAEMKQAVQQAPWQSKASCNANGSQGQPQGLPQMGITGNCQLATVGYMMARIPGSNCDVPTMVVIAQQPQQQQAPVERTPLRAPAGHTSLRTALARKNKSEAVSLFVPGQMVDNAEQKAVVQSAADPLAQGLTRETFEGELPSIGSEGHFDGSCKRCAFFSKGRCKNGKDCTHCHFAHEPRSRQRKRCSARARRCSGEDEADELAESNAGENPNILTEVLTYLAEPVEVADPSEDCDPCWNKPRTTTASTTATIEDTCQSDSDGDSPVSEVDCKQDLAAASIKKFNDALLAAQAYTSSPQQAEVFPMQIAAKDAPIAFGEVDIDMSTPSVSALSDLDKSASPDTSDSEVASQDSEPTSRKRSSLSSSPSSWGAMQSSRKASTLESCTTAEIERMARSLLNKLTEERFESLCTKILALPLSTPEHLAVVAAEIFAKATTQDCFRALYTELCMRLDKHLDGQASSIGGKAFRKALVTACQATFERHLQPPDASLLLDLDEEERFEVEMKLKTRRLGNMRFIGDLLVRRLLAPKLLPPIVHELLNGNEDSLESLIALVTVVAPEFEAKPSLYQAPLKDAFQVFRRKLNDKSLSSRMSA